jgi:hypothetical protein
MSRHTPTRPRLRDLRLTRDQSSDWQRLTGLRGAVDLCDRGYRGGAAHFRSNSQAAKHRTWTWNLSRPGLSPSRANWISNSISSFVTGNLQIVQAAPTPGPPHVRSGGRPRAFHSGPRRGLFRERQIRQASGEPATRRSERDGAPHSETGDAKPNARGRDARCVNQGTQWKARPVYHHLRPRSSDPVLWTDGARSAYAGSDERTAPMKSVIAIGLWSTAETPSAFAASNARSLPGEE